MNKKKIVYKPRNLPKYFLHVLIMFFISHTIHMKEEYYSNFCQRGK